MKIRAHTGEVRKRTEARPGAPARGDEARTTQTKTHAHSSE